MTVNESRKQVLNLYKSLLYMGRDYPQGYIFFRDRAHRAFTKNKEIQDPNKILELLNFGEYIMNELKALYSLKKYRTMKSRYYQDPLPPVESSSLNLQEPQDSTKKS